MAEPLAKLPAKMSPKLLVLQPRAARAADAGDAGGAGGDDEGDGGEAAVAHGAMVLAVPAAIPS